MKAKHPIPGVVYHPENVVERYRREGVLKDENLGQVLAEAAASHPDNIAVVGSSVRWTYRELGELSDRFGAALLALGLKPLDPVVFQVGNIPEIFPALYGCFRAGLLPVCTLASHREQEIGFIADLVSAKAHIVQADLKFDLVAFGKKMGDAVGSLEHLIAVRSADAGGQLTLDGLVANMPLEKARESLSDIEVDPYNVAIYQLSGGTTGLPKVIPRFHSEYVCNIQSWADASEINSDTISYWPLPAIHNAAIVCFHTPVHFRGGTVVVDQDHDPKTFLGTIEREKVTFTGAATPVIVRCVDSGLIDRYDLSSVRCFLSMREAALIDEDFGVPGHHIFGMAEGLCMRTVPGAPETIRHQCIGRPVNTFDEVRVIKPGTDEDAEPGEVGEFLARGPYTIRGYFSAPDHNAKTFTEEGYYRTGDLLKVHEVDGIKYYSFEGRAKDNIDRGAEKISAEEVERYVVMHPSVFDCLVIGMPDRVMGERVCAYVILEEGCEPPTVPELAAFLVDQGIAKFKCPERIEIVENFPATQVGKTSKGILREDIARKLEAERNAGTAASG